jgi:endonuclease/exonuclease/phosphatase (EEP) superfamily protein YafD
VSPLNPLRILVAATAMEIALAAAIAALAGLAGFRNGWLDVINNFAPMILALGLVAIVLALPSLQGATRVVTISVAMVAVVYGLALIAPEVARALTLRPRADGGGLRVLTANVWTDNPTPDAAIDKILERNADVVFLQESDGTVQPLLARLRPRYPFSSNCPGSGVQIFVKTPIIAHGCGLRGAPGLDFAWVQTESSNEPLVLATTHFSWPFPPDGQRPQRIQRASVAREIRELTADALILGGDFNTTPWSFGMRDQDRLFAPLRRQTFAMFSWPARLNQLHRPWPIPILPIDHLYCGRDWRLSKISRLAVPGSDHLAIEATFLRQP